MKFEKFLYRTVVGFFNVVRKITGRQLVLISMVSHALAANPLAGARFVGAITVLFVGFELTFHLLDHLGWKKESGLREKRDCPDIP